MIRGGARSGLAIAEFEMIERIGLIVTAS